MIKSYRQFPYIYAAQTVYILDKIAAADFMASDSPAANLVSNFTWTNEDQNLVALDIESGMTTEEAAQKWIDANKDKVDAWLAAG